jgi:hypothetical protein
VSGGPHLQFADLSAASAQKEPKLINYFFLLMTVLAGFSLASLFQCIGKTKSHFSRESEDELRMT